MNKAILLDIYTIAWKEWKEIFSQENNLKTGFLYLLLCVCILAIFMPLPPKNAEELASSPVDLIYFWSGIPYSLIVLYRQFGIFEERQRKTLSTLIATKIPDCAIVFGKIGATVILCWISTVLAGMLSIIKANVVNQENILFFYTGKSLLFGVCVSLLFTILTASSGMFISFSTKTATQFQWLYLIVSSFFLLFLCYFINSIIYKIVSIQQSIGLETASLELSFLIYLISFTIIDILVLVFTFKRFKRDDLIS